MLGLILPGHEAVDYLISWFYFDFEWRLLIACLHSKMYLFIARNWSQRKKNILAFFHECWICSRLLSTRVPGSVLVYGWPRIASLISIGYIFLIKLAVFELDWVSHRGKKRRSSGRPYFKGAFVQYFPYDNNNTTVAEIWAGVVHMHLWR